MVTLGDSWDNTGELSSHNLWAAGPHVVFSTWHIHGSQLHLTHECALSCSQFPQVHLRCPSTRSNHLHARASRLAHPTVRSTLLYLYLSSLRCRSHTLPTSLECHPVCFSYAVSDAILTISILLCLVWHTWHIR